ncbi:MAG TPA: hypothetical protein VFI03_08815 [Solirubrobacterales bacterium]|nr:hypothetical protein [Solirubrobacterales bacterium]
MLVLSTASLLVPAAAASAVECPNEAIRNAQGSTYLPDCRAYELVSLYDKGGTPVGNGRITADGGAVVYSIAGGAPGSTAGGSSWFRAKRSGGRWDSSNLLPSRSALDASSWSVAFGASSDLTRFVGTASSGFSLGETIVRFGTAGLDDLVFTFPVSSGPFGKLSSADLSVVVATNRASLDPDHPWIPATGTEQLYEFDSAGAHLISLLPDESVGACGLIPGGRFSFASNTHSTSRQHWLSTDGERVIFPSRGNGGDCFSTLTPSHLYLREGGADGTTTLIDGPVLSGEDSGGQFIQATPDGSRIFYLSSSSLDPADANTTADVYRYTVGQGNECITCLVPEADVTNPGPHSSVPSLAVAEDGSQVYFTSAKELVPGEGSVGENNLYRVDVAAETIDYISPSSGIAATPLEGFSLSSDGMTLVFRAHALSLNEATSPPSENGGKPQLYRYAVDEGRVSCVSCPDGEPVSEGVPTRLAGNDLFEVDYVQPMTIDGTSVFFATPEPLVERDVNQATDIYAWRDGDVSLITDGVSAQLPGKGSPQFLGATPDGESVLFMSSSKLVAGIAEGSASPTAQLYVARVGGGLPPPPPPARPCVGDACQGLLESILPRGSVATGASRGADSHRRRGSGNCQKLRQRVRKLKRAAASGKGEAKAKRKLRAARHQAAQCEGGRS